MGQLENFKLRLKTLEAKMAQECLILTEFGRMASLLNNEPTHQGKMCCGRRPMATLEDGKQIWQAKFI